MERVISDEEKIRRAIEISQRRNTSYYNNRTTRVNVNDKKNFRLFKRMILQIIICLLIYSIFYLISTTNYIFSDKVINSATTILNYDINFQKLYNDFQEFIELKMNRDDNITQAESSVQENTIINNSIISEKNSSVEVEKLEDNNDIMKSDAKEVKKICEFKKPLSGTITSEFGQREVTSKVMSTNHKGIDIAAESGTSIQSAITGIVSQANENTEYGKFIKILNGKVMTVYAHCKELKVKKGDKVNKGDKIATVGSTGNSTGPHLHFEIRLSNRYINPRYVIEF